MTDMTTSNELGHVAHQLGLPLAKVQRTVELLDEGNTVPFITRYRKDHTGGLDEEQIRVIQAEVAKQRQLADRKATILKSIEAQGKLTPELAEQIRAARSPKHLEDLYLPYKPKKQTLATVARQRGLEPLANEVLAGGAELADLAARAAQFVSPENKLATVEDVLAGVRHILAEQFSERAELRSRLRRVLQRTGKLISVRIEPEQRAASIAAAQAGGSADDLDLIDVADESPESTTNVLAESADGLSAESSGDAAQASPAAAEAAGAAEAHGDEGVHDDLGADDLHDDDDDLTDEMVDELAEESAVATDGTGDAEAAEGTEPSAEAPAEGADQSHADSATGADAPSTESAPPTVRAIAMPPLRLTARQQARAAAREAKKKKKQKLLESLYKDYYKYEEPLSKVPPHRVLAINRGERSHVLRVKILADDAAIEQEALGLLVPAGHSHGEFLQNCVRDALMRLVVPSLEREIRREMTERAEQHAVEVFIRNLRKLLLQPPVHGRRVLAVDPGFRSGCKLAALDEFGNLIDHGTIHIIGPDQHRQVCRQRLIDMILKHHLSVIAIGNGTACRETEVLVADILANELHDRDVAYVIVNEAGASVYSTSPIGREELPKYDATVRGAVSIGRRLLDPLSELVKINPANIGVGLYQHDLKAKHLRDSLDAVVESCVNYVGVDVNTASPALLRYVSGLNQLTARRLYEYRLSHGPFHNREQFKQVPGFGDATFVQAAGFLKIIGGNAPLDATWIHPESYEVARIVLERINSSEAELAAVVAPTRNPAPAAPPQPTVFGGETLLAAVEMTSSTAPTDPAVEIVASDSPSTEGDASVETSTVVDVNETPVAEAVTTESPTDAHMAGIETVTPPPLTEVASFVASSLDDPPTGATGDLTVAVDDGSPSEAVGEPLAARIEQLDVEGLAAELQIGTLALHDMLASLARPKRDPREDLPPPIFRRGIMKLEDLQPGMELSGTVLNVVDFGVFVDIGLSDSALIHISRLADRFIRDPHEVVGVGDVLKVWVVEVDRARRRVSLTAIQPGTERPREARPTRRPEKSGQRPPAQQRPQGQGQQGQQRSQSQQRPQQGQRPQGQRPPQGGGGRRAPAGGQGGQHTGGQRQATPPKFTRPPQKARPAKPVRPITRDMIDGKEPMRTFSDLMQFYQKKKDDDAPDTPPTSG